MQPDPSRRPVADLVGDLQHGTPAERSRSCAEILRRFDPLFRKYWRRLRDVEYEDFLQEVARKMAASISGLRNRHAFPGYLERIVVSTMSDMMRRSGGMPSAGDLEKVVAHARNEALDLLVVASYLAQLPLRDALALELSVLREFDLAECARLMNLSSSGFRTLKSRAIKRLRAIIVREKALITKT
jgi:RNA polymerase sigma factor (sigma-70 family)